jgi:protein-disulfide isomerase
VPAGNILQLIVPPSGPVEVRYGNSPEGSRVEPAAIAGIWRDAVAVKPQLIAGVKTSSDAAYHRMMDVLDQLHRAGARRISLQMAETSGSVMKLYVVLAAVAVIGLGVIGFAVRRGGTATLSPIAIDGLDDPEGLAQLAQGEQKGDETAPLTIIEFADFQCPYCAMFALQEEPRLDQAYVRTGKAKFVFYDWPITSEHQHAFLAARAARCAGEQEAFWPYHDTLYRNQAEWSLVEDAAETFVGYADQLELDRGAFAACVNSDRYADVVTANMQLGNQLGVDRTPTIVVENGGEIHAVEPGFAPIRAYIDAIPSPHNPP